MKLKLYLHTKHDIGEMLKVYETVFSGKVYKQQKYSLERVEERKLPHALVGKTYYANLTIFNDITIMFSIWNEKSNQPYGTNVSHVIYFDHKDQDLFEKTYHALRKHPAFTMVYDRGKDYGWGTDIVKFNDKFDNAWVLEWSQQ